MAASEFNPANHENLTIVESRAVRMLFTTIRNKNTQQRDYIIHADRLLTILAEEGLACLAEEATVDTPCGTYAGLQHPDPSGICVVSIVRSGDICLEAVRNLVPDASVGKILMQRDEEDPEKKAKLYYSKLPKDINTKKVMLVDPMLATGGSAIGAINVLVDAGVPSANILFLVTVAAPEGVKKVFETFPELKMICLAVDECLNEEKFIVPGLGDFGDRYYGT